MTQHAAAVAMMRHSQPPAGAAARKYLVLFHTVSCGQNGPGLGSDEQDIVLIVYLVVDLQGNKVLDVKRICVRPEPLDVNDNILSDEMRTEFKISPQEIKSAPTLNQVIHDLSCTWRDSIPGSYSLVTDGQLTLRQSLFPEAFRKNITLPSCFHSFHDLRKEFVSVVNCSVHQDTLTVENMATMLGIPLPNAQDSAIRTVEAMASILERLSADGLNLHQPESISTHLLQGIRSKGEKVDGNCVVRARGLPWQASDTDIAHFFLGLNIAPGGVALCLSSQGRRNGEALVLFDSVAHRDMALKRHKHHIGNRYIEVYKASGEDFIEVAGGNNTEAQEFLSRGGKVIIRMRGLPYDCTQKQVMKSCIKCKKTENVILHRFPADKNRRTIWEDNLGLRFLKISKEARVCSMHFRPEDYLPHSKRLKKDAIPVPEDNTVPDENLDWFKQKFCDARTSIPPLTLPEPVFINLPFSFNNEHEIGVEVMLDVVDSSSNEEGKNFMEEKTDNYEETGNSTDIGVNISSSEENLKEIEGCNNKTANEEKTSSIEEVTMENKTEIKSSTVMTDKEETRSSTVTEVTISSCENFKQIESNQDGRNKETANEEKTNSMKEVTIKCIEEIESSTVMKDKNSSQKSEELLKKKKNVSQLKANQNVKRGRPQNDKTQLKKLLLKTRPDLSIGIVNRIVEKKKRSNKYSSLEISQAFVLKSLSGKAVDYARKEFFLHPIPSKKTMCRYVSDYKIRPGMQVNFLCLLKEKLRVAENGQVKNCMLIFDEMSIEEKCEFDVQDDMIFGPFKKLLLFMLRGIDEDWTQIVYLNFDETITKNLCDSVVKACQGYGVVVRGFVFDNGNTRLLKELMINEYVHCMPNADYPGKNIYFFPDVPHCIKLLRNHLLDYGLIIMDKSGDNSKPLHTIDKKLYQSLIEANQIQDGESSDLYLSHLTWMDIEVEGSDRQKVNVALKMFNTQTAEAFSVLLERDDIRDTLNIIMNWFIVFQSKDVGNKVTKLKEAFGVYEEEQSQAIKQMTDLIQRIRFCNTPNRVVHKPFMKGILTANQSLLDLFSELKSEGVATLYTSRLEQDILEGRFSLVRALGNYKSHPTPLEALNRIRTLCFTTNVDYLIKKSNVQIPSRAEGPMVSAALLPPDIPVVHKTVPGVKDIGDFALTYIAGWTVKKRKALRQDSPICQERVDSTEWIKRITKGKLAFPRKEVIEMVRTCEKEFQVHHGGFLRRLGAVRGLTNKIMEKHSLFDKDIIDFFKSGSKNCEVLDSEQGVLFVKKLDGRSTGDAFVLFGDEKDAEKALSKHKELIGTRYIELFRSTTAEVQQVLNRTIEQHPHNKNNPNQNNSMAHKLINGGGMHGGVQASGGLAQNALHGALQPQVPLIPQQLITAGVKKDCIRLRGLPYEAQVEHILEFLGEHSRNIVVQGVHMVFNAQGQPSGEAFIQMDTEHSAHSAHTNKHNRYMTIGKKQRYIEVLQCSGEDMSLVLTGGLAALHSPANPNALGAPKLPLLPPSATPMLPLNNAAALHHHHQQQQAAAAAAAAAAADPLQHLNPALLMSNMYLVPPPAATHHHIPTSTFDLQLLAAASQAGAGQVFMLPPTHQRLFAAHGAAAQHHGFPGAQMGHPQSQFLLQPPPQLRAGLQLSFPPPTAVTAAVTSLAQQPSKRTHDQAFTSPTELLPTKRPPVVYTSEAGGVVGGCSTAAAPVLALPQIQSNFT